jgi:hypothetical protein
MSDRKCVARHRSHHRCTSVDEYSGPGQFASVFIGRNPAATFPGALPTGVVFARQRHWASVSR